MLALFCVVYVPALHWMHVNPRMSLSQIRSRPPSHTHCSSDDPGAEVDHGGQARQPGPRNPVYELDGHAVQTEPPAGLCTPTPHRWQVLGLVAAVALE